MKLESLSKDLFLQVELSEAAMVLGGLAVAPVGGGTFYDCWTFLNDGTARSDDKDQDAADQA
jgi:hypothetical protein